MGLPGASTNQLSILWEFLLSGGCYTRIFGTVYSEKKKRNKRDIPCKKNATHHPPIKTLINTILRCIKIWAIKFHIFRWNQRIWGCNLSPLLFLVAGLFFFSIGFLLNTFAFLLWKLSNFSLTALLFHFTIANTKPTTIDKATTMITRLCIFHSFS